jgi:hypothetical protein
MLRCCIFCRAEASPDLRLQYCAGCQSALYCSKACQKKDWKEKQHKQICKLLNVGHGGMQVRTNLHTSRCLRLKEYAEEVGRSLDKDDKRFFKLFEESTSEGSRAAAQKMSKIAKRQSKHNQTCLLFYSISFLVRYSDSKMLSWPNSPLLVLLQFVDPNALSGRKDARSEEGEMRAPPLVHLADLADSSDYSTHKNQLILAKQLVEHGANVDAVSIPQGDTPLQKACYGGNVTNLDFVEFLLEGGADPNHQDNSAMIPLMCTIPDAPGAAKFLLNWPTTDVNTTARSGVSNLARVRNVIRDFSDKVADPDNAERVQNKFLLRQWREIEEMLVGRGAADTVITALE